MHLHFLGRRIFGQVLADVGRDKTKCAGAVAIQYGPIKEAPKSALDLRTAKPAAILAVRPGRYQGREITEFGAFAHLMLEPARIEAGKLRVR